MERVGENTRKRYIKEDMFTYNSRADRPLQRSELNAVAENVGVDNPTSLKNKEYVRQAIRDKCGITNREGTFDKRELIDIAQETEHVESEKELAVDGEA